MYGIHLKFFNSMRVVGNYFDLEVIRSVSYILTTEPLSLIA